MVYIYVSHSLVNCLGQTGRFKVCNLHLSWTCIKPEVAQCNAHPMLGWKNCKIHILWTWGSSRFLEVHYIWDSWGYPQGALWQRLFGSYTHPSLGLHCPCYCGWVHQWFFWFHLGQFLGAWNLDLGCLSKAVLVQSSLVWCLHWVSLLLVWGCKNYLGWATLWNIFLFRSNFLEIS